MKKSYSAFKDISDVCVKFNLDCVYKNFINAKELKVNDYFLVKLMRSFDNPGSFSSEFATCERIIFPIIEEASAINNLPTWSQMPLNVDKSLNLWGNPDYILAPQLPGGIRYKLPVVCLGEAKKNDFEKGWGQVSAEMYAAQLANIKKIKEDLERVNTLTPIEKVLNIKLEKSKKKKLKFDTNLIEKINNITIYGLVTDGNEWGFGKLENRVFTIHKEKLKTPEELQRVFNILNWMFCEARKNADKLLEFSI